MSNELGRCRIVQIQASNAVPAQPPAQSDPHVTLSSRTAWGLRTTGFAWFIENMNAMEPATGFSVNVWKRDPTSGRWAVLVDLLQPSDKWATACGVSVCDLWWQVAGTAPGAVLIHVEEIGASP